MSFLHCRRGILILGGMTLILGGMTLILGGMTLLSSLLCHMDPPDKTNDTDIGWNDTDISGMTLILGGMTCDIG